MYFTLEAGTPLSPSSVGTGLAALVFVKNAAIPGLCSQFGMHPVIYKLLCAQPPEANRACGAIGHNKVEESILIKTRSHPCRIDKGIRIT